MPRKNVRIVGGRPLIAYSIDAARASRSLSAFITSTDDDEIAAVAERSGSPVLRRPVDLAADDTPMVRVVAHALTALEEVHGPFDHVVVLQPTAPLRSGADIDGAVSRLIDTGADSVVSVYLVSDAHPSRMYRLVDGRLVPYDAEPSSRLRQDLPPVYHRNGAVYACRRALVHDKQTLIGPDVRPYVMPRERSVNIDDEIDLVLADILLTSGALERVGSA